jgi:hypothetical protein
MINCPSTLAIDSFENSTFSIYPNPSTNYFYLQNNTNNKLKLELFNLEGKFILSKESAENEIELNLSEFENSVYFLKINSNDGHQIAYKKIIKL